MTCNSHCLLWQSLWEPKQWCLWGKKVLKKHLQRSIDKLVAAKEQLPEEEVRDVDTGYHRSNQGSSAAERWSHVSDCSQEKGFCATRGVGEDTAAAQEACASVEHEIEEEEDQDEEMHEEDHQNNTRDPYRDWYNSSDCTSQSRELKEMRTADFADLRYPCTSAKNSSPCCCGSWYDGETAADSCIADRCTCGGNCKLRGPDRVSCPCNSKAASDGSRGGAGSPRYDSSWELCRRCYECTEPLLAAHPNGTDRISKEVR